MRAGAFGWVGGLGAESHLTLPEKEKEESTDTREGAMGLGRWWRARREGVGGGRRDLCAMRGPGPLFLFPYTAPCISASFRFC